MLWKQILTDARIKETKSIIFKEDGIEISSGPVMMRKRKEPSEMIPVAKHSTKIQAV